MDSINRLPRSITMFLLVVGIVILSMAFFLVYGLFSDLFVSDTALYLLALGTLGISIISFSLVLFSTLKRSQWVPSIIEGAMLWFVMFLLLFLLLYQFCIIAYLLFLGVMICIIGASLSPFILIFNKEDKEEKNEPMSEGFTFNDYTLYCKDVCLKGSQKQHRIYYFSKRNPKDGIPCEKPETHIVGVNKRTGLPYLKRKKTI